MADTRFKVIITDNDHGFITPEEQAFAGSDCDLQLLQLHDEDSVIAACAEADGLLSQYAPLTARVIEQLKRCRMISRYGVGYDTIDVAAATQAGIMVANVPDYGTEEVALQALTLALQIFRGTDVCNRSVHGGEWEYRVAGNIDDADKTRVGVFGTGRIGTSFAKKAHAIGFEVLACDIVPEKIPAFARPVDFDTLLRESDIISVHCDLNADTRHIFSDAAFSAMKKQAVFVNTSRGGVLDEQALIRALEAGRFRGVGLDVVEKEPLPADHGLRAFERVVLTPHIAWYSVQSRIRLKERTASNVRQTLEGVVSPYLVNPEVLQSPNLRFRKH